MDVEKNYYDNNKQFDDVWEEKGLILDEKKGEPSELIDIINALGENGTA